MNRFLHDLPVETSDPTNQIALLIDADNVAAQHADEIVKILSAQGALGVRRVYGNWQKPHLHGWQDAILRHALQPMQQFDYCKGKNATDMALTVDAMDLLYTQQIAVFAIVSSDCDFTPLVLRLKRAGKTVLGFGSHATASALVKACDRFYPLKQNANQPLTVAENAGLSVPKLSGEQLRDNKKLLNAITQALASCQDSDGWATVANVGEVLKRRSNISSQDFGYQTLTYLLKELAVFALKTQQGRYWVKVAAAQSPNMLPYDTAAAAATTANQLKCDTALINAIRQAIGECQDIHGWAKVQQVGVKLSQANISSKNYGYASLSKLLAVIDLFELRQQDTHYWVKDKRHAKPKQG